MPEIWVLLAIAAATLQTARNAFARSLAPILSPMLVSWARFAFNLPFAALLWLVIGMRYGWPTLSPRFWSLVLLTAVTQLLGNVALIAAFKRSNFAQSILLHKLEVAIAALLGMLVFSELPTPVGWVGIGLCVVGTLGINLARHARDESALRVTLVSSLLKSLRLDRGGLLALTSGVLLAITGFTLKLATAALHESNADLAFGLPAAVHTLFHTVWIEVVCLTVAILVRERASFARVQEHAKTMGVIGLTGFLASLCWFWAYPLALVAYVKAVGQVEGVLSIVLALVVFKEREVKRQIPAMLVLLAGIALVLMG